MKDQIINGTREHEIYKICNTSLFISNINFTHFHEKRFDIRTNIFRNNISTHILHDFKWNECLVSLNTVTVLIKLPLSCIKKTCPVFCTSRYVSFFYKQCFLYTMLKFRFWYFRTQICSWSCSSCYHNFDGWIPARRSLAPSRGCTQRWLATGDICPICIWGRNKL